jgi:FeoC like transcriptional regulator
VQANLPERLLQLLDKGGIHSTAELARQLETTEALVAAMAENLARQGYLTPIEAGCETSCSGCWAAASCSRPPLAAMLALTNRGRQIARRLQ